jgi:hypothetical protein
MCPNKRAKRAPEHDLGNDHAEECTPGLVRDRVTMSGGTSFNRDEYTVPLCKHDKPRKRISHAVSARVRLR